MDEFAPSVINREEFATWVHDALNRLYDSPYLQKHPLADALTDRGADNLHRSQSLRRVLLGAIEAMRPRKGVPAYSPDWRAYRILELRYIEGSSPAQAMDQLALAKSQYFREQARALESVTTTLWDQWQKTHQKTASTADAANAPRVELARSEAERLSANATWEEIDGAHLLNELRPVVDTLAKAKGVPIHLDLAHRLTVPHADRVMLRQAILNIITYALDIAPGRHVEVSSFAGEREMGIHILVRKPAAPIQRRKVAVEICQQLMATLGGSLHLENREGEHWEASLVWSTSASRVLLVIDDNKGVIDLFRRYLTGYNWQVIGATSGTRARHAIAETKPMVIILDVMMPKEDGWEFLAALRADGATQRIPIIVCSVLNEPQLALTLGATAYLPKPVTQEALLQALTPWSRPRPNPEPAH